MTEYGLIGFPLVHSFSKQFFTEKFAKEHIDAQYLNFEIETVDNLINIIKEHPQLKGLNVTIPHKQHVMPLLNELSTEAQEIGAVNVIAIQRTDHGDITLKGYNADVIGFEDSIRPLLKPHHTKALILGTGGASKAVDYGLRRLGLKTTFVSRTPREGMLTYSQLDSEIMGQYTVVVNCTPLGTFPHQDTFADIPYHLLGNQHLLYDLVYNPSKTMFLQKGEAQGATIKNGLEMLHLQALASWDFWNNTL